MNVAVNVQPDWAMTIVPLPDRPQESLQKALRDPATFEQDPGVPPGVGVGQGEVVDSHGFWQLHAARSATATRTPAERFRSLITVSGG